MAQESEVKIGAIIILYNPEWRVTDALIEQILLQTQAICIIDNSHVGVSRFDNVSNVNYQHYSQNIGLAKAQNIGLDFLIKLKCEYGIIFDQDSTIYPSFIHDLYSKYLIFKKNSNAAAIGPQIICEFSNNEVKAKIQRELHDTESNINIVPQIISSGMMIELKQLQFIGKKLDCLFIDGIDHEWCWRAKQKGFSVAIARDVKMLHRQGDIKRTFMGLSYRVSSPIRLYFQFRNTIYLLRKDYVPMYWKIKNVIILPIKFVVMTVFERDRILRGKYMLVGLLHGLKAKLGSYKD